MKKDVSFNFNSRSYTVVQDNIGRVSVYYGLVTMPLHTRPDLEQAALKALGIKYGDVIDLDDMRAMRKEEAHG